MEMDNGVKITSIHIVAAIFTGLLTTFISLGMVPVIGKNDLIAGFIGVVILYAMGRLCDRLFGKQNGFKKWLWDGIIPFAFAWFVVWTLLLNYAPVIF
ncbi:hypothetical protein ALNOE001_08660 [Candidatus Methanobinarius endosymbioticus]|uniref:Uncharacterized protein n=1 Tax=Candidatus Methanobinarius endosymbioticus TaxID=2006182 RepID=A0A366MDN0_9EURY|nr:hypothetical protein ALNOE001_08660 [Candidatus Methanobinarius endosymbioticus]